ncbi:MAG: aminopeptidase [Anaerolineales bacterium]
MDVETLAIKTIETLAVAPGQVIWIWASTHSLDFIEALAFHIRVRGAFWMVRLIMEPLLQRIGKEVPPEYLGLVPVHELRWLNDINAIIEVRDHGGHIPGVEILARRTMAAEWIVLMDEADRLGCRRFIVINPTQALAEAYGVPLDVLKRRYWQAVNIDDAALDSSQNQVAQQLANGQQVHITTPLGTDLHLQIGGRPIFQDHSGLPRGEVYVAPLETSAEGVAVIDRTFIHGKLVEKLKLTFVDGKVARIDAPQVESVRLLEELLAASSGDKDRIAELGIGLNPGVNELTGDSLLDEKLNGSIHIGIGMNDRFGGQNHANLHLDLVMLHPSLWLDGSLIHLPG